MISGRYFIFFNILIYRIEFISMSYSPKSIEITGHDVNGADRLSGPLKESYSMGSIGMQVGVKFVLN